MPTLFKQVELTFAETISQLAVTNPFHQDEVKRLEKQAAKLSILDDGRKVPLRSVVERPNILPLLRKAEKLAETVHSRFKSSESVANKELQLYENLALFVLYFLYRDRLSATVLEALEPTNGYARDEKEIGIEAKYYREFEKEFRRFLRPLWKRGFKKSSAAHLFACFFQIRRAYKLIHANIFGESRPIQRLRADVWHSIFTHDMLRYRDMLFDRMHDITTLITGPSGTGKDLVAEAIGLSRYVAFRPATMRFEENIAGAFHPVNLSALSLEIIESELFGHCQGAYTGAVKDRIGWFEICESSHSVFLDEIGELSGAIQVKLLRVLQNRTFQRLGETNLRSFQGKVLAATNRDLSLEVQEGRFRRDFFYRLCSDQISTPSLKDQLDDNSSELPRLVKFISQRLFGNAAEPLSNDVVAWIEQHLGVDYRWPGNIRELEQCIRNVLVRQEYHPLLSIQPDQFAAFTEKLRTLQVTADELNRWYCTLAYAKTGSYVAAAKALALNRRTVKQRIDPQLLSLITQPGMNLPTEK